RKTFCKGQHCQRGEMTIGLSMNSPGCAHCCGCEMGGLPVQFQKCQGKWG
ncbi:mCG1030069, partial [Mus musculus]